MLGHLLSGSPVSQALKKRLDSKSGLFYFVRFFSLTFRAFAAAREALVAISFRLFAVRALARAFPPSLPSEIAAGFFCCSMWQNIALP